MFGGETMWQWLNEQTTRVWLGDPRRVDAAEQAAALGGWAEKRGAPEIAGRFYRRALGIDAANVAARAGLGRVRFRQPAQPFMDEIRRRAPADVCEVIVEVRNPCNYRCFYCVAAGHNNEPVRKFDLDAINDSFSRIKADLIVTQFDCGGGEPTVHPQFPALLRICASYGAVSFPSNNSQDPARWLPTEIAKRIYVRAAVHPESETEAGLDRYARHARHLLDAGCAFSSTFISHPTRIAKIPEYRSYFAARGIPFMPVPFIGDHEGSLYPYAYSEEEKNQIGLVDSEANWYQQIQPHVTRIRNFRGIPCLAGYRSLTITRDGGIRRCVYDARKLQQPLAEPTPCAVKHCGCGMVLRDLNALGAPDFYNFFAERVGREQVDVMWMDAAAAAFNYASLTDALVTENERMYDELMRAFGKDEFPEA